MGSLSSFRRCKGVKELIEKINEYKKHWNDAPVLYELFLKVNELIDQREQDKKNRDEQMDGILQRIKNLENDKK